MKVKYIRRDIPEEISEEGGAFIQLVGQSTVGLTASIKEAIRMLYCVGEASLIEGYFFGLCRSVFAGIKSDGAARSIGDLRFYPVCGGTFDLEKGWDPLVNDVRIKAQLVNGVELDVSDWEFEDATEGRIAFSVESVSDGETSGVVSTNKNVQINGKNFPTDVKVSWVCGTKSGEVAAAKLTRTVSRLDIDKTAFSTLTQTEQGLPITFTIKGSYNKATKSAIVKYEAGPTLVRAASGAEESEYQWGFVYDGEYITVEGTTLGYAVGDSVLITNNEHTWTFSGTGAIFEGTDTKLSLDGSEATREDGQTGFAPGSDCAITLTYKGSTIHAAFKMNR